MVVRKVIRLIEFVLRGTFLRVIIGRKLSYVIVVSYGIVII